MTEKFEFIDGEKQNYPLTAMFMWLAVSSSGFYEWRDRPESATAARRRELIAFIHHVFTDSDGTYGYRRVHAQLRRLGVTVGPDLVRELMRQQDLVACQPRPWRVTTVQDPDADEVPDLVGRDFTASAPGQKMVGDITYIHTWTGWLYLATVLDCHTKLVLGYAMADHMRTSLVMEAISMADRNYVLPVDAIFHSDRGSQYTSTDFQAHLRHLSVKSSMGRTGVCWDNAMAESFNAALKNERVYRTAYPTRDHARKDISRYIELRYNRKRLHSSIAYNTPHEIYLAYHQRNTAA